MIFRITFYIDNFFILSFDQLKLFFFLLSFLFPVSRDERQDQIEQCYGDHQ